MKKSVEKSYKSVEKLYKYVENPVEKRLATRWITCVTSAIEMVCVVSCRRSRLGRRRTTIEESRVVTIRPAHGDDHAAICHVYTLALGHLQEAARGDA